MICQKHRNVGSVTGEVIIERGGLVLTHFPQLENDLATRGHLLLEPRRHITEIFDMNDAEAAALGGIIRDAARVMKATLECEHVYVYRINDKVAHLHFHLIPRYSGTPKEYWGTRIMEYPNARKIPLADVKTLAAKMKMNLS